MRLRPGLVVLVLVGLGLVAAAGALVLTPTRSLARAPRVVEIPAHQGVRGIAHRLREADIIRSETGFLALAVVRGSVRHLKAGEYEFPQGASTVDVMALLENGRVKQHAVLHREGATVAELARVLEAEGLAPAAEVLATARDRAFLARLGIEGPSAEGYLFPDTYQFVRGMTTQEMLGRMVQRLRSRLTPEMLDRARRRSLSVHQLLTLASIIEREAVVRDELRLISAVFWNRLRLDMPLQADPTVQYATGKDRQALTRLDLQVEHPFNTYRHPGLPPGPIASPGREAIEAALDPAPVKYLYFVARDDQRHQFSTTVEEHNAAVTRYRHNRVRGQAHEGARG